MTKLPLINPKDLPKTIRDNNRNLVGGLPITHPLASDLPAFAATVAKLLGGEVTFRSTRSLVPTLRVLVPEDLAAELSALEKKCDVRAGLFFETEPGVDHVEVIVSYTVKGKALTRLKRVLLERVFDLIKQPAPVA